MADQPYEYPTPHAPYILESPPIAISPQSQDTSPELDPGSSTRSESHTGDMEHSQAFSHLANPGPDSGRGVSQFIVMGQSYDPDGLGKVIYEIAAKSSRIGMHKREIAAKFREQLNSLADYLQDFKEAYRVSRNMREARADLEPYINEWEYLVPRVQELVSMCGEAAETVPLHEDGSYTQEAWDAFMKAFLGVGHLPRRTWNIMRDMGFLIDYYEQDGEQALNRLWSQLSVE